MDVSEINDIRQSSQFRGVSFSKYKKTDVKNEFVDKILLKIVGIATIF